MTSAPQPTLSQIVGLYSNAVGRWGPDSKQTNAVRAAYTGNTEFVAYADALDRVKRRLGGSGMDDREQATGANP